MACEQITRTVLLALYFVILAVCIALFFVDDIFRYIICSSVVIGLTFGALWSLIPPKYYISGKKGHKSVSHQESSASNSIQNNNKVTMAAINVAPSSPSSPSSDEANNDNDNDNDTDINENKTNTNPNPNTNDNERKGDGDENKESPVMVTQPSQVQLIDENEEIEQDKVKTKPKRGRLYFLDNLRVLLTAGVISHHIIVSLGGIGWWYYQIGVYRHTFQVFTTTVLAMNQSFGMCLFFFISGYFTPLSCDKRGRIEFIRVKFRKLGIPLVLWMYGFNPLMFWLSTVAVRHESNKFFIGMFKYGNMFTLYGAGPGWYIIWLLMFDVIYITFGDHIPVFKMKFPSFKMLYFWGIIIGILQYFIIKLDTFLYLPLVFGSIYYDIIFFLCGIIAARNNWLKYGISDMSRNKVWFIRIFTPILIITYIIIAIFDFKFQWGFLSKTDKLTDDCDNTNDDIDTPLWVWIIWYAYMGCVGITLSINSLQFCEEFLNWTNKITTWFARQAYTVYIIHPFVLTPIVWSYVGIMVKNGANVPLFCEDSWSSRTHLGNNSHLWWGFVYTAILTYIVIWPIAWVIRQIPGLNYVL